MGNTSPGTDDIQRQVLQHTLEEVALRQDPDLQDCCVICLDTITRPCEPLPCGHRNFDDPCISTWLAGTPKCPLCKATVPSAIISATSHRPSGPSLQSTRHTQESQYRLAGHGPGYRPRHRPAPFSTRACPHPASSLPQQQQQLTIEFRRSLYRAQRFSKHVGSNRLSRYRELSPSLFRDDPELLRRARMFIRRELRVFSFLDVAGSGSQEAESSQQDTPVQAGRSPTSVTTRRRANNAEFLLEYVVAILKSVDIVGSAGQAEEMLSDFVGRQEARLFLHELRAWLRSPYTKLEDWDRAVQYPSVGDGQYSRDTLSRRRLGRSRRHLSPSASLSASHPAQGQERYHAGRKFRDRHVRRGGDFYRPRPAFAEDGHRR